MPNLTRNTFVPITDRRWRSVYSPSAGIVRPEWFGAKGDGVYNATSNLMEGTDDTTALQDAIAYLEANGGGTLLLGPKTYLFSSTLGTGTDVVNINATDPIRIMGVGCKITYTGGGATMYKGSVLRYTALNGTPAMQFKRNYGGIVLRDFALVGKDYELVDMAALMQSGGVVASGNGNGIVLKVCTSAHIEGVRIEGFDGDGVSLGRGINGGLGIAIYAEDCYYGVFSRCQIRGCRVGMDHYRCNAQEVVSAKISYCTLGARNIQRMRSSAIEGCATYGLLWDDEATQSWRTCSLSDCYFEGNGQKDNAEYAHIWGGNSGLEVCDRWLILTGITDFGRGSELVERTNRFTCIGGHWTELQLHGRIKRNFNTHPGGTPDWEFGNLTTTGTTVFDLGHTSTNNDDADNSLWAETWQNRSNIVFLGVRRIETHQLPTHWGGVPNVNGLVASHASAHVNTAITANRLYVQPVDIPHDFNSLAIQIGVNVAAAGGSLARAVLYAVHPQNKSPDAHLSTSNTIAVDATGDKTMTINYSGQRGQYWVAIESDGAPTLNCVSAASTLQQIFRSTPGANRYAAYVAHTFTDPVPKPFGSPTLINTAETPFLIIDSN